MVTAPPLPTQRMALTIERQCVQKVETAWRLPIQAAALVMTA